MREVRLLRGASADIALGQRFYERQSPGLGQYFRDAINADPRSLKALAGVHRIVFGFHRSLSNRLPYAIYYRIKDDAVLVYGVLDCRRNPDDLQRRLTGR